MININERFEMVDITDMKYMINYLKKSFDYDKSKFILMEKKANVFSYSVNHQLNTNVSFTHLFIKNDIYPSELFINVTIGGCSFLKLSLFLLKEMNLVRTVENGFIIRLPIDYMLGYIPLQKIVYHQFGIWINTLKKYNIEEICVLIDISNDTMTDFLFPYLFYDTTINNASDILVKNNEHEYYNYVFDKLLTCREANIFGYFLTCNTKDLMSVELYINNSKFFTCSEKLLINLIIDENLVWIPMCNSHGELTNSTNILNTNKIEKTKVNLLFKKSQNNTMSINPCGYAYIEFQSGMAFSMYDIHHINLFDTNNKKNITLEDNYLIKKNKTSYVIHNFQKPNEIVIFGKLNNYVSDYVDINKINKITIFNTYINTFMNMNITKLKIIMDPDTHDMYSLNNLPNNLEKLYIKNFSRSQKYVIFTNLPSCVKKIKLRDIQINEKSKIPFNTQIINLPPTTTII